MGFLSALKIFQEKYEAGFPDITGPKTMQIQFFGDRVDFSVTSIFSPKKFSLKPDDILEVGMNQETYRSAGKAVAGAVIGGLLTFGVGTLVGAAVGGKRRRENHLHLVVRYMDTDCEIFLKPSKHMAQIYSEFKLLMTKQTKKPELDTPVSQALDSASQLHKLAELRDKGILTNEEFEKEKQKILA